LVFKIRISKKEGELKKNSESLLKELETKLDRAEIDSLKDYLDKQLKKIKKIQVNHILFDYI
jgi:hypothetical protein